MSSGYQHKPSSSGGTPGGAAGGDLGGTYPNPTVNATHAGSTHLALATNAVVLGTAAAAGAAATTLRSNDTIAAFDATAPVTQAYSDVAATGSVAFAARRDHKHGMPAAGAGSDLATTVLAPAGSETLAANLSTVAVRKYTIASGQLLTIGSGARFRIL